MTAERAVGSGAPAASSPVLAQERRIHSFGVTARGRASVSRVLVGLAEYGCVTLADRVPPQPGGEPGCVLVGPTGIYVVGPVPWTGRVEVRSGSLTHDGVVDNRPVEAVAAAATAVGVVLTGVCPFPLSAVAALCFLGPDLPHGVGRLGRAHLLRYDQLGGFVLGRGTVLSRRQVDAVRDRLQSALPAVDQRRPVARRTGEGPLSGVDLLFVSGWQAGSSWRVQVRDGRGIALGVLDPVTGAFRASAPCDAGILRTLVLDALRRTPHEPDWVPAPEHGAQLTPPSSPAAILVARRWRGYGKDRLYCHLYRIDGVEDLGWVDTQGRVSAEAARSDLLRSVATAARDAGILSR